MGKFKTFARNWIAAFLYPKPFIGLFYLPRFFKHWIQYKRIARGQNIGFMDFHPCLGDWSTNTPFDAHYFYQGAWLARKLAQSKPIQHVDIASSVLTIGVLSAMVNTVFVDYRPLKTSLPGLTSLPGDILHLQFSDRSVVSLSCLHVIEHIGLGRYGDPIDPDGSLKAAKELQRVIASGGNIFLSLPIGKERVCFNAHRVHAPASVLAMFTEMSLVDFSYVDDAGQFHQKQSIEVASSLQYGCGMFHFQKA